MKDEEAALICKAIGDLNRLQIVQLLTQGERCACDILERVSITQPTLSHHMKILCAINLVQARKEGKWCHYSLNCEKFKEFKEYIGKLVCC